MFSFSVVIHFNLFVVLVTFNSWFLKCCIISTITTISRVGLCLNFQGMPLYFAICWFLNDYTMYINWLHFNLLYVLIEEFGLKVLFSYCFTLLLSRHHSLFEFYSFIFSREVKQTRKTYNFRQIYKHPVETVDTWTTYLTRQFFRLPDLNQIIRFLSHYSEKRYLWLVHVDQLFKIK